MSDTTASLPDATPSENLPAGPSAFRGVGTTIGIILLAQFLPLPGTLPAYLLRSPFPRASAVLMVLGFLAASGLVVALARGRWREGWRDALPLRRVEAPVAAWGAAALGGLLLATLGLILLADRVFHLKEPGHIQGLPSLVIAGAAPLFEELIFRGFGLAWLRERVSDRRAMVLTAAAFALSHTPVQYLGTFAFGLLLAWLALRTRSLVVPILGHMAWNGLLLLLDGLGRTSPLRAEALPWPILTGVALAGLVLLGTALRALRARFAEVQP